MADLPRDQYQQKFKDDAFVRHEAARRSAAVQRSRPAQLDLFGGGGYTSEELAAGKAGIADARAQLAGQYQRSRLKEFWGPKFRNPWDDGPPTGLVGAKVPVTPKGGPSCLGCGDH